MRHAVTAALTVVLVLGSASAATAAARTPLSAPATYTTLERSELVTDYSKPVLVRSAPTSLRAGKSYPLTASWSGTIDTRSLMGLRMRCRMPGGSYKLSVWSTTNVGAQIGHPSNAIYGRWLFEPKADGAYTCELVGQAGHAVHRDRIVTVTDAALTLYPGKAGGSEWRMTSDDRRVNSTSPTTWALKRSWTAPAGTTSIRLWSGPEVSSYSTGAHNPFVAEVTTIANQVGASGKVHKSWSRTTVEQIPGGLHHVKFDQPMTLDPRSDKPLNFRFAVRLRWIAYDGVFDRHGGILHGKSVGTITRTTNVYSALHAYPLAGV